MIMGFCQKFMNKAVFLSWNRMKHLSLWWVYYVLIGILKWFVVEWGSPSAQPDRKGLEWKNYFHIPASKLPILKVYLTFRDDKRHRYGFPDWTSNPVIQPTIFEFDWVGFSCFLTSMGVMIDILWNVRDAFMIVYDYFHQSWSAIDTISEGQTAHNRDDLVSFGTGVVP